MQILNYVTKDIKGNRSITRTVFILGSIVVHIKLIFSGMTFNGFIFEKFSGGDYGMALGALGAIYVLRRNTETNDKKEDL
jgi:hypothetical protein